jgi:Rrf2 family transcriptional regulator, cysteine metabolism repressor
MLKLSTKARYALRAMMQLALHEGAGPVQLREIARAQRLSPKYLEQLAIPLRHAGLLRTERGPTGGYELARPSTAITALDVVEAVEGPLALLDCIGRAAACDRTESCAARDLWVQVQEAIDGVLSKATLAQLRENQQLCDTDPPLCYQI